MSSRVSSDSQTQSSGIDTSPGGGDAESTTISAGGETESSTTSSEVETESVIDASRVEAVVDSTLGPDHVFEILKNQRRRRTLRYLANHDESVTTGALAEHIAALEHDTTVAALTWRERKRVYIGLYQCHLPKLDDAGAITFEKAGGLITPGPAADQFDPYLSVEPHERADWSRYYVLLAGLSGLAFVTQSVDEFWGGLGLSLVQLLVGIIGSFALLSIVHLCATSDLSLSHLPVLGER